MAVNKHAGMELERVIVNRSGAELGVKLGRRMNVTVIPKSDDVCLRQGRFQLATMRIK